MVRCGRYYRRLYCRTDDLKYAAEQICGSQIRHIVIYFAVSDFLCQHWFESGASEYDRYSDIVRRASCHCGSADESDRLRLGAKLMKFSNRESLQIGVGMISRGEVALIVANKGNAVGLMSSSLFGPVVIMVVATTIITPIVLKLVFCDAL